MSYLRRLASWLALFNVGWAGAGAAVAALSIMVALGASEPVIRRTGMILQLLGISTIIWGIYETRSLFGLPPLMSKVKALLALFPIPGRVNSYTATVNATMPRLTGTGRAYSSSAPPPNPTPDQRLDSLERNVTLLNQRINATQLEIDQLASSAKAAVAHERAQREAEDARIRSTLDGLGTGGIHISAMGASWLFVGVILSSVPGEIARMIN